MERGGSGDGGRGGRLPTDTTGWRPEVLRAAEARMETGDGRAAGRRTRASDGSARRDDIRTAAGADGSSGSGAGAGAGSGSGSGSLRRLDRGHLRRGSQAARREPGAGGRGPGPRSWAGVERRKHCARSKRNNTSSLQQPRSAEEAAEEHEHHEHHHRRRRQMANARLARCLPTGLSSPYAVASSWKLRLRAPGKSRRAPGS